MSKPTKSVETPMPRLGPRLVVLAIVSALVGGFLAHLWLRDPTVTPNTRDPAPPETATQQSDTPSGTFRFYDLLVENEVDVQVEPTPDRPVDDRKVFLQVASFKDATDAENARVRLLMMNLNPVIETRGDWHRLIVGPFEKRREQFLIQDKLVKNGFQYLELRR
ncbi:SPOR domain-containing protein [Litorivicinus lipolyticus]|uniref:SPOR domain-containing protein n=1 Tax=Litorivicinus lipolyticus TaxID=418701 RepID=UPI003B5B9AC7